MERNHIKGTQNNDFLTDTILDDDIFALDGDDQIKVSSENNVVDAGSGFDVLYLDYYSSPNGITSFLERTSFLNR